MFEKHQCQIHRRGELPILGDKQAQPSPSPAIGQLKLRPAAGLEVQSQSPHSLSINYVDSLSISTHVKCLKARCQILRLAFSCS